MDVPWSPAPARPGKPPRERLSVDRIVDAALELMRTQGYEAVSMRSVARALGTGPASLYAHVANREDLDQLVADRISGQLVLPEPDPQRWQEQVKQVMRDVLALYRAHPGSARATMAIIPTGDGTLRIAEGMMAICRAGGVPDRLSAWVCDLLSLYVGAVAVEEHIWNERAKAAGGSGDPAEMEAMVQRVHDYFATLPSDRFPILKASAGVMTSGTGDERFEFGLDLMLSGLAAMAAREGA